MPKENAVFSFRSSIHLAPNAPQNPRIENAVALSAQFFQFFINKDATTRVLNTAPILDPSVAPALNLWFCLLDMFLLQDHLSLKWLKQLTFTGGSMIPETCGGAAIG